MAKDSPYFKFYVSEYNDGDIQLCSMAAQGLFTNLCSHYWSKEGQLLLSKAKRLWKVSEKVWKELIEERVIKIEDDKIIISFLDEQLNERVELSKKNSKNVSKRYEKQGFKSTPVENGTTTKQVPVYNKEEKREEEKIIREEEKRGEESELAHLGCEASVKKILEDEVWIHKITPLTKNKNLKGAARAAFLYLESKPTRFQNADINELKATTLKWLENSKPIINGTHIKSSAVITGGKESGAL